MEVAEPKASPERALANVWGLAPELAVSVSAAFLADVGLEIAKLAWPTVIGGLDFFTLISGKIAVGVIAGVIFGYWRQSLASLGRLAGDFQKYADSVTETVAAGSIARAYEPKSLDTKAGSRANDIHLRAVSIAKAVQNLVRSNSSWSIVVSELLGEEKEALEQGNYSFFLNTYLSIYLALIEQHLQIAKDTNRRLHIRSFTNAIPPDWRDGDLSRVGNIMASFAEGKAELVRRMKDEGHVMRMIAIVSDDPGLTKAGFRSHKEVVEDWATLSEEARCKYLDLLHTSPSEAVLLDLGNTPLVFGDGLAEFIYFGFSDRESESPARWRACIAGSFSSENKLLLGRFAFFDETGSDFEVVDVENTPKLHKPGAIGAPSRITLRLSELPNFLEVDRCWGNARAFRFDNLMTFPKAWALAADIWHSSTEATEVSGLFGSLFKRNGLVLDAAAGTGFHSKLLQHDGFQVTALTFDEAEQSELVRRCGSAFQCATGDWRRLPSALTSGGFDGVICLGSSLPYHSSWANPHRAPLPPAAELDASLDKVLQQFRACLNPTGTLIMGLSRFTRRDVIVPAPVSYDRTVGGKQYRMTWSFRFDWALREREWTCQITSEDRTFAPQSFTVRGHLFDHKELEEKALALFHEVSVVSVSPDHYDKYVICKRPR